MPGISPSLGQHFGLPNADALKQELESLSSSTGSVQDLSMRVLASAGYGGGSLDDRLRQWELAGFPSLGG